MWKQNKGKRTNFRYSFYIFFPSRERETPCGFQREPRKVHLPLVKYKEEYYCLGADSIMTPKDPLESKLTRTDGQKSITSWVWVKMLVEHFLWYCVAQSCKIWENFTVKIWKSKGMESQSFPWTHLPPIVPDLSYQDAERCSWDPLWNRIKATDSTHWESNSDSSAPFCFENCMTAPLTTKQGKYTCNHVLRYGCFGLIWISTVDNRTWFESDLIWHIQRCKNRKQFSLELPLVVPGK